jgi:NAD-dependent SIR2 family protein deacetylase
VKRKENMAHRLKLKCLICGYKWTSHYTNNDNWIPGLCPKCKTQLKVKSGYRVLVEEVVKPDSQGFESEVPFDEFKNSKIKFERYDTKELKEKVYKMLNDNE